MNSHCAGYPESVILFAEVGITLGVTIEVEAMTSNTKPEYRTGSARTLPTHSWVWLVSVVIAISAITNAIG